MSHIKVDDIAYVRFGAPDLQKMRAFLLDFGMREAEDYGDGVLRMRGHGSAPFIHETVQGKAGFLGLAFRATSPQDLAVLAKAEGVPVEPLRAPGGGQKITLRDPNGYTIEVISGQTPVPELATAGVQTWNSSATKARASIAKRVAAGPSHVMRLGHIVLGINNMEETYAWWHARFGLLISDKVLAPNGDFAVAFTRCDRGTALADHHTVCFGVFPGQSPKIHHAAFEVVDLDDLMAGHEHLKRGGYHHDWGIGRHILGSQVFDYWKDPCGHEIEHWTDGDLFTADVPTNITDLDTALGLQWGPPPPAGFA